jgi:hypothetical protein
MAAQVMLPIILAVLQRGVERPVEEMTQLRVERTKAGYQLLGVPVVGLLEASHPVTRKVQELPEVTTA